MRGSKTNAKTAETMRQRLAGGESGRSISRSLGLAVGTVNKYKQMWENTEEFKELQEQKRLELIEQTSENLKKASKILSNKLDKLENEDESEKASILQIATTFGIMVEKLALMQGKATNIVGGEIDIKTKITLENAYKRLNNDE
jgi:hypothetical protein